MTIDYCLSDFICVIAPGLIPNLKEGWKYHFPNKSKIKCDLIAAKFLYS